MMNKSILSIPYILFALILLIQGCATNEAFQTDAAGPPWPWTHLRFKNNPEDFQFAVISDRTGRMRPGIFEEGVKKTNLLHPEFVITIGDVIEGYEKNAEQLEKEWDDLMEIVDHFEMPFFFVPGNHDYNNELTMNAWKERFGKDYYHFIYKDVLFLCVNSSVPIGQDQVSYFEEVLAKHPNVRWTLVFLHKPRWNREQKEDWDNFERILADRNYTVFAGHMHVYNKEVRNGKNYYTLATTGGTSGLSGPALGQFDHIMWITMTDNGPIITNLSIEGIFDDDPRDGYNP